MSKQQYLWDILNLDENFKCADVDNAYSKIENKTDEVKLAWKILRDEYYSEVYKKYLSLDTVIKAGFILDSLELEDLNYYNLSLLTTPVSKLKGLKEEKENPVVLLTTGGFDPIHDGHLYMMDFAKKVLEENGYNVVGGYFSPSHESYVSTKPYYKINPYERLDLCQEAVKDSDWLMIDPWESIYVKTYINFTDVIQRLEKYLQKHINPKIQVAYVFGGDNSEFMYCFENKGIGICVEREGHSEKFIEMKNKFTGKNNFFINNKSIMSTYSSRTIRQRQTYNYNTPNYSKEDGDYVIRNEGMLPLANYKKYVSEEVLEKAHEKFLKQLIILLKQAFDNTLDIKTINMHEQLEKATHELKDKQTISLDTYYKGVYDIETSRLFDISDIQKKYISLIGRIGFDTIEKQIEKIEGGSYILVDDDSATGKTIREVISNLPERIKIEQIYLLANMINEKIFDIVDLRDFIIGVKNGGLIVKLPNGEVTRAPYMLPYVCLKSRATICASKEMQVSIKLWEMNKEFYQEIGGDITLEQTDEGFQKLMNYIGFDNKTLLTDICDWHIEKLKQNEIKIVECKYGEREDIIKFLVNITTEEFGFSHWRDYFERKLVEKYQKGNNKFWIALNSQNQIIGTCGALQESEKTVKMNCFYIDSKYRGQGIGKKFYDLFLEFAKKENYKTIILCTFKEFDRAIKFYEKRGFELYETTEDEFWYKKEI